MSSCFDKTSFVLTSCGRFDLLQRTIASMEPWVFAEKSLIDDSGHPHATLDTLKDRGFLILNNPTPKGQPYSIDKAYATCPYIFHDDWAFDQLDFSAHVLDLNPRLSSYINLEERYQRRYPAAYQQKLDDLIRVERKSATLRYPRFSQRDRSFNPHLIKRATMKRFSPPVLQRTLYSPSRAKKGCLSIPKNAYSYRGATTYL